MQDQFLRETELYKEYKDVFTREHAAAFLDNPRVNPLTERAIKRGRDRHLVLTLLCKDLFGVDPFQKPVRRQRLVELCAPEQLTTLPALGDWCFDVERLTLREDREQKKEALLASWTERAEELTTAYKMSWVQDSEDRPKFSKWELVELLEMGKALQSGFKYYSNSRPRMKPLLTRLGEMLKKADLVDDVTPREAWQEELKTAAMHWCVVSMQDSYGSGRALARQVLERLHNMMQDAASQYERAQQVMTRYAMYRPKRNPNETLDDIIEAHYQVEEWMLTRTLDRESEWRKKVTEVLLRHRIFSESDIAKCLDEPWKALHKQYKLFRKNIELWLLNAGSGVASWDEVEGWRAAKVFHSSTCAVCWGEMTHNAVAEEARSVCLHSCGHCMCRACFEALVTAARDVVATDLTKNLLQCPHCRTRVACVSHLPTDLSQAPLVQTD